MTKLIHISFNKWKQYEYKFRHTSRIPKEQDRVFNINFKDKYRHALSLNNGEVENNEKWWILSYISESPKHEYFLIKSIWPIKLVDTSFLYAQ